MTYRFVMVCPSCNKLSETEQDCFVPEPTVNCGDCLMDRVEIVRMKVAKVTYTTTEERKK